MSLAAIFLASCVLISHNQVSEESEPHADKDMHIGLVTEHELPSVLQMLDANQNSNLTDIDMET